MAAAVAATVARGGGDGAGGGGCLSTPLRPVQWRPVGVVSHTQSTGTAACL